MILCDYCGEEMIGNVLVSNLGTITSLVTLHAECEQPFVDAAKNITGKRPRPNPDKPAA